MLKQVLHQDPDSRRAVIPLFTEEDLGRSSEVVDVPCCCSLQFLMRDEKLCLVTYMRSNDMMTGFGYDIFLFTMLQELMALELNLPLGWYQHVTASMHLYSKDYEKAVLIRKLGVSDNIIMMDPMREVTQLPEVLRYEQLIRCSEISDPLMDIELDSYWIQIILVLLFYKLVKKADHDGMQAVTERLNGSPFLVLLRSMRPDE
jgi:thymidylate synthase